MKSLQRFPGMIENSERLQLFNIGSQLEPNSVVIEFGTFLGASMACILDGYGSSLKQIPKDESPILITYDGFTCDLRSDLYAYVRQYCISSGLIDYLSEDGSKINWKEAAKKVIKSSKCNNPVRLSVIEGFVSKGFILPSQINKIDFLHLDMPKDWFTLRPILHACANLFEPGSIIAFQDYAFELSGELIFAFNHLCKWGVLSPVRAFASTVYYRVVGEFKLNHLSKIEELLMNHDKYFIGNAMKFKKYSDIIEGFRPSEKSAIQLGAVHLIANSSLSENQKMAILSDLLKDAMLDSDNSFYTRLARILASTMSSNTPLSK